MLSRFKNLERKEIFKIIFVFATVSIFIIFKFSHLALRFGDTNAYLYMADGLWKGLMPYRDYFLADPPFLVILLALFKLIFGKSLILFQTLPILFEAVTAVVVYFLLKKWSNPLAFLAPFILLFSFTVLSTSDYMTGVQLVVFLSALAIWFWEKESFVLSGLFWSLAVLTKLYVIPAIVVFVLLALFKREYRQVWRFSLGFISTAIVIFLPFIGSIGKIFEYLVVHQFSRPMGNDKWYVIRFFFQKEYFILLLGFFGMIWSVSKRWIIILPCLAMMYFFLIYKDLYYLYFDSFLFYVVILFLELVGFLWLKSIEVKRLLVIPLVLYIIFALFSFSDYYNNFKNQGLFVNSSEVGDYIRTLPNNLDLYGSHELTPLVALESDRKLFDNQIDTNTQAFASKALDLEQISIKAVNSGIYLLAKVQDFPEYGINDFGYGGYFSESVFKRFCKRLKDFPVIYSNEKGAVYRCKV